MKNNIFTLMTVYISTLLLGQTAFAFTFKCPTPDDIRTIVQYTDVTNVLAHSGDGTQPAVPGQSYYAFWETNSFHTGLDFNFSIMKIPAASPDEALAAVKNALPSLAAPDPVPLIMNNNGNAYEICSYTIGNGYEAVAYSTF